MEPVAAMTDHMTAADLHACQWHDEQGLATRFHDSAEAAEADAAALVRAGVRRCVVFAVARQAVEGVQDGHTADLTDFGATSGPVAVRDEGQR